MTIASRYDSSSGAILAEVESVLDKARVQPTTVTIVFTDVNGPKGGVGIRCAVTAMVPRQATLRIAPLAATAPLAFAKAVKALRAACPKPLTAAARSVDGPRSTTWPNE